MNSIDLENLDRRSNPGTFPMDAAQQASSAAVFFSAAFGGLNDVIHLYRAGVKDVLLVDTDAEKLAAMSSSYPENWEFLVGDAFTVARERADLGTSYDLVCCDPFTNLVPRVLRDDFPSFYRLARSRLVLGLSAEYATEHGTGLTPAAVAAHLTELHDRPILVEALVHRSDFRGGMYWIVIDRREDTS